MVKLLQCILFVLNFLFVIGNEDFKQRILKNGDSNVRNEVKTKVDSDIFPSINVMNRNDHVKRADRGYETKHFENTALDDDIVTNVKNSSRRFRSNIFNFVNALQDVLRSKETKVNKSKTKKRGNKKNVTKILLDKIPESIKKRRKTNTKTQPDHILHSKSYNLTIVSKMDKSGNKTHNLYVNGVQFSFNNYVQSITIGYNKKTKETMEPGDITDDLILEINTYQSDSDSDTDSDASSYNDTSSDSDTSGESDTSNFWGHPKNRGRKDWFHRHVVDLPDLGQNINKYVQTLHEKKINNINKYMQTLHEKMGNKKWKVTYNNKYGNATYGKSVHYGPSYNYRNKPTDNGKPKYNGEPTYENDPSYTYTDKLTNHTYRVFDNKGGNKKYGHGIVYGPEYHIELE